MPGDRAQSGVAEQPSPFELIQQKAAALEAVVESLGDGLLVVSDAGEIVEANAAAVRLLGCREKGDLRGPLTDVLARLTRPNGAAFSVDDLGFWRTIRQGHVERATCLLRSQFGGPCSIETVTGVVRADDGTVLGASIVARDVSAQWRRERDLLLIASVADGLVSATDVPGALGGLADRVVQDLADWCAIFHVDGPLDTPTESLRLGAMRHRDGRRIPGLGDLLARAKVRVSDGFVGAAMRAGSPLLLPDLTREAVLRYAGQGVEAQLASRLELRSLVVAPLRGADGPIGAICIGWTDGRHRADEQDALLLGELARRTAMTLEQTHFQQSIEQNLLRLDRALQRLEQVLDSMGAGLMVFGGDGRAALINATARGMIGLTDDGLGLSLPELMAGSEEHLEDTRQLDDLLAQTDDPSFEARGELRLHAPSPIDVEWIASPVRDDEGQLLGQVIVWLDVTHIRAAERVKDDLAGDLSDALRSPLQAISTNAVSALRRGRRTGGDGTLLHSLEVILRNARQVSMHVNDLVDAARFDATNLSLDLADVDVRAVIEQAVDEARAMTTVHRFRLDVPPAVPTPRWDQHRVRQAILHILTNAIKYSPDGGQVTIKVRAQVEGVIVSIRDRGLGIPPEEQERVFARFYRLSGDAVRRKIRGNGLGLYLVRGVVEAHEGTIWLDSTGLPGEGTTVNLLLPWQPGQQQPG
ncbi:MAG: PAS domain S-box protein [Chloroflexi bacterium]|nr:PAS domain S-box protein [Chloroflexota bacterium]